MIRTRRLYVLCMSLVFTFAFVACSDSSSSSSSDTDTDEDSPIPLATSTLVLPDQLDIVTAGDSATVRYARAELAEAFSDAGSDYVTDVQRRHVWMEALEPVEQVNSILCFASQLRAEAFAGEGAYIALVDEARCFDEEGTEGGGENGQSSGAENAPEFMEVIVLSTRESDTSPLEVDVWIPEMAGDDDAETIKFHATVSEGASDTNSFGSFVFNYEMSIGGVLRGGGEIKTVDGLDDQIGFTYFEDFDHGDGSRMQSASVVMNADETSGVALIGGTREGDSMEGGGFHALSFNPANVLVQDADSFAELDYHGGDFAGMCLSRTEFDEMVWRYDLYDFATGERVEVNSGFSIRYDSDDDGEEDSFGFVGYWGLWTEEEGALENGDTVVKEVFDHGEGDGTADAETFTIVSAPGRLIKNTVETLSLMDARGIRFHVWDESAMDAGYDQWQVKYLTIADDGAASDGFHRMAGIAWAEFGEEITTLVSPALITLADHEDMYMFSDQLGGGVQYRAGDTVLTYFKETFLNGSETGAGEEFASASTLNLVCLQECPKGTLAADILTDFDGANGPFESTNDVSTPYAYTFSTDGAAPFTLLRSSNSEPVQYAAGLTENSLSTSPFSWGLRSGRLVSQAVLDTLSEPWQIWDSTLVTEFYVWETGLHDWNRMTAVRNAAGEIETFEKPIDFNYVHADANDRTGDAGDFGGQTYLLSYGGHGDFWGIPFMQGEDDGDRWGPLFNLVDGLQLGESGEYVLKAREIEQTMQTVSASECSSLEITDPPADVPTGITVGITMGDAPVVDAPPAVIEGEIQGVVE